MTYYYIYQITNLVNAKIYVGVHKTSNLNDGYMGSGKIIRSAITKHGISNFSKDILEFFDTSEAMYAREKEIVTHEFLLREDTYNLRRGGFGGFDYINAIGLNGGTVGLPRARNKIKELCNVPTWVAQRNKAISEGVKKTYSSGRTNQPPSFKGKQHSSNTKKKMSDTAKLRLQDSTKNSQFGTMWITDGTSNKKIKKDAVIPEGWNKGRNMVP